MSKCLLFAYGLLKTTFQPPRTLTRFWSDSVPGQLYDLGPYPGAVNIGNPESWFEGEVLEIEESELAEIDEFEEVPVKYRRKRVTTRGGHEVWVYEYNYTLPFELEPIERWPAS